MNLSVFVTFFHCALYSSYQQIAVISTPCAVAPVTETIKYFCSALLQYCITYAVTDVSLMSCYPTALWAEVTLTQIQRNAINRKMQL
jgi:hypothetical protein